MLEKGNAPAGHAGAQGGWYFSEYLFNLSPSYHNLPAPSSPTRRSASHPIAAGLPAQTQERTSAHD
jgi:hypothetical protein